MRGDALNAAGARAFQRTIGEGLKVPNEQPKKWRLWLKTARASVFQTAQRSAAVWTGAFHNPLSSSSSKETVMEQPAISREVT